MADNPNLLVRVEDATLSTVEGPVKVVVSNLASPHEVAEALASAGARAAVEGTRLAVVTTPSRLVDATGRALGAAAAHEMEEVLDRALTAWHAPALSLSTGTGEVASPVVMGVVNVTPDSFSDGGRFYDPGRGHAPAIEHGLALAGAGADIVDVGGESSRPGAEPVDVDEERSRTLPVVDALAQEGITVSVDTRHPEVAKDAVEAGAAVVNDISGGAPEMLDLVATAGCAYVAMHMQGEPADMQHDPRYDDVVAEVFESLGDAIRRCVAAGIAAERIVVDPGIGFGKTVEHNLALLRRLREFSSLGVPVMVGVSRKSFIGRLSGTEGPERRLPGSLAAAALAVQGRASIVRVHDVDETVQAVRVADAITRGVAS